MNRFNFKLVSSDEQNTTSSSLHVRREPVQHGVRPTQTGAPSLV